ncbi:MAG: hypothetical protein VW420_08755 [Schleiferiaceae bacterium]
MMQRSLWGAVYALAIFWICNGRPWSPFLLALPLLGVAWEILQMERLQAAQKLAGIGYAGLAGWSTWSLIDTWVKRPASFSFPSFC